MQSEYGVLIVLGILMILNPMIPRLLDRISFPPLVGYILLGVAVSVLNQKWQFVTPGFEQTFSLLAELGVVALLFHVGLKSHTQALLAKLPEASFIWVGDVVTNLACGFLVAFYVLGMSLETSLVIATAFSATSLAVSVAIWDKRNALDSSNGQLLVDVAELDDLSGVLLLALLLAVLSAMQGDTEIALLPTIGWSLFWVLLKLIAFLSGCYLFAHYVEPKFTRFNRRWDTQTGLAISVLGSALAISSIAGYLGFSLAIGALFAGLAFSRDPQTVHAEGKFSYFYELFTPFFFVQIGMQVDPSEVLSSLSIGMVLLVPAVFGKFFGVFLPALRTVNRMDAMRLGVSMVPRAEIALVVVYQCQQLGKEVVNDRVFAALVFISIATSIFSPMVLRFLWPENRED
jgi:Kef-type K+ transport system membrane component KefB